MTQPYETLWLHGNSTIEVFNGAFSLTLKEQCHSLPSIRERAFSIKIKYLVCFLVITEIHVRKGGRTKPWVVCIQSQGTFNFFRRFGKPHDVESFAAVGEIPREHTPAMVSYLMYGQIAGNALVATLLDLANRGYFDIVESEEEKKTLFGGAKKVKDFEFKLTNDALTDLAAYEAELVSFLMSRVGDGHSFKMSEMKKTASKNRTEFRKWFMKWKKSVHEEGKRQGFFEPYPPGAVAINLVAGVLILAVGIIMCVTSDSAAGYRRLSAAGYRRHSPRRFAGELRRGVGCCWVGETSRRI